jgi:predicted ATPase
MLNHKSARIALLGAAGMGKTSLARAVLHHPDVVSRYKDRYFVPCDSATSSIEVAALIGAYLGLKPANDLTKPVIGYLSGKATALLVLDNLETVWEPTKSRSGVEELLSLLTDLPLALIVGNCLFKHLFISIHV